MIADKIIVFDPIPSIHLTSFAGWVFRKKFESIIREQDGEIETHLFSYHGESEYANVDEEFIDLFRAVDDRNPIFREILLYNDHLKPLGEVDIDEDMSVCVDLDELVQSLIQESNGGLQHIRFKAIDPIPRHGQYYGEAYFISIDQVRCEDLTYDDASFKLFLKRSSPSLYRDFLEHSKPPVIVTKFQRDLEYCVNSYDLREAGGFDRLNISSDLSGCKLYVGKDGKLRGSLT